MRELWERILRSEEIDGWGIAQDGDFTYRGRLVVPNDQELEEAILVEAYKSRFSIHLRSTKMYQDPKRQY